MTTSSKNETDNISEENIEIQEKSYQFDRKKANKEFGEMLVGLEVYHSLFYELGTLGIPVWTEDIPTAGVLFYKIHNRVGFQWNPKFWDSLTVYQREFIACHEALHVFLSHGKRSIDATQPQIANIAADIVVNEILVENFGFSKIHLRELSKSLVWLDTTFEQEALDSKEVLPGQSMEYYYHKLIDIVKQAIKDGKINPQSGKGGITIYPDDEFKDLLGETIDDHSGLKETFDTNAEKSIQGKLEDNLTDPEKDNFTELTESDLDKEKNKKKSKDHKAGSLAGSMCHTIKKKQTKYNYKWSDIIKNWKLRNDKPDEIEEVWHYPNRRISSLHNLFLPTEYEGKSMGQCEKVDVWFFMDTSYSCVHLKEQFFECALSFPEDKFDVRPFCFDTKVYDINLKDGKLYGFGGTRFDIIESRIQTILAKEKKRYPDVVFIFTDGYGNAVHPEYPEKWYWFLDGDYNSKEYIDNKSVTYNLKDFKQ